jgi:hypothetical protein
MTQRMTHSRPRIYRFSDVAHHDEVDDAAQSGS